MALEREIGCSISAVTVRRMVRELRLAEAEVFVPLVHRPGDSGQVDFFLLHTSRAVAISGNSTPPGGLT